MKYASSFLLEHGMPEEYIKHFEKCAKEQAISKLMESIDLDQWYAIRITRQQCPDQYGEKVLYGYEINEAQTEYIKVASWEEMTLSPSQSAWQRLKNCARYMRGR